MVVYFDYLNLPRTTSRKAWYAMWRQYREAIRREAQMDAFTIDFLRKNNAPANIRDEVIDNLVNPPIILFP